VCGVDSYNFLNYQLIVADSGLGLILHLRSEIRLKQAERVT
jgi:hypothetical protein